MDKPTPTSVGPLPTEKGLEAGLASAEYGPQPTSPTEKEMDPGGDMREKPRPKDRFSATTTARDINPRDEESQQQEGQKTTERLEPSQKWTNHQLFYVFGLDGVGSFVVSGGINFAIAYAMYSSQDPATKPIRLWELPNTLAGDAAVTMFIQCIVTWFIEWGLVTLDLSTKGVRPIGFVRQPSHPVLRWFFFLPTKSPARKQCLESSSDGQDRGDGTSALSSLQWWWWQPMSSAGRGKSFGANFGIVVHQALRGLLMAVVFGLLVWPVGVAALTGFGRSVGGAERLYGTKWTPQVFKLVLGGALGLLTTPPMAMFWLVRAGWDAQGEV